MGFTAEKFVGITTALDAVFTVTDRFFSDNSGEIKDKLILAQNTILATQKQLSIAVREIEELKQALDVKDKYKPVQRRGYTALVSADEVENFSAEASVDTVQFVCPVCIQTEGIVVPMQPTVITDGQFRRMFRCTHCLRTEFPQAGSEAFTPPPASRIEYDPFDI